MLRLFTILNVLFLPSVWALSGLDIMKRVDDNNKNFETMSSEVLMTIKRAEESRERNFHNRKKHDGNTTKSIIKFYSPASVKGTSLLTHSYDRENRKDQWIYFPALKSLSKITGDKEKESFMGSDYTYSDVAGRRLNQDNHELVKEDEEHYYIKSTPKDQNDLYSQINLVVKKESPVISKAIFFTKDGKLKTLTGDPRSLTRLGPMSLYTRSLMVNHITEGTTELQMSNIQRNIPIDDNDVGIKGLKQ